MDEFDNEDPPDDLGNPYHVKDSTVKKTGGRSLFNVSI